MIIGPRKCLILRTFGGLITFGTHWYDYIPFVMLKGLCQKFTFWKDLAKFVTNFKETSQQNPVTEFLV